MTSPELLELLLHDVPRFNAWREEHPDAAVDLSKADLRGANLFGAMLVGAALDGAALDDASLGRANLSGASLQGASLKRADLREANFGYTEMINARIMNTALGRAAVRGADLSDADLRGARAEGANFVECPLGDADFTDCNLDGARLKRTALEDEDDRPEAPPASGDFEGMIERLRAESDAVIDDAARFAIFVHLTGAQDEGAAERSGLLNAILGSLDFDQERVDRLLPTEQLRLESVQVTPPTSHWLRRVYVRLMCALAECSSSYPSIQLQTLGHFGEQYGITYRAMARIMSDELGVEVRAG
ncbi:MAG: pentapeptide repeat-containing protein [Alphaproteobacteria bacterium]|nr:pentapeptide repeat-containing protein [Alphaproteobacteria bacterium]